MGYEIEGKLLEVCDCKVLCPCWIGEDPDNGTCDGVVSYHIEKGTIDGLPVGGLTMAMVARIPGNVFQGNWKAAVFVDDNASPAQEAALMKVFSGQAGGPVADLVKLVGEIVAVQRAKIHFEVNEGRGTLSIDKILDARIDPYVGATGNNTTLNDSIFSTIPGSPAYVSKATRYQRTTAQFGLPDVDLQNRNAIQGSFRFVA